MTRGSAARFAALCLFWGSSFLLIALSLRGLSPQQIVVARVTAGAAVVWTIVLLRRQPLPRGRDVWAQLAVAGALGNVVPFMLFSFATERIPSGLAGLLNATTPLFTLGLAVAALPDERMSRTRTAGFVIGFAGVAVVIGPAATGSAAAPVGWQVACLVGAASYGAAFVFASRFLTGRGLPPLSLAAGQLGASSVLLWLAAPIVATQPMDLTPTVVVSILVMGAVGTGAAYIIYYTLITDVGATTSSMVTYVIPIVAVVLGVVVLGEPFGWHVVAGGATVFVGIAVAEGRLRRRPTVDAPLPVSRRETDAVDESDR